jgi:aminopeptidase N
MAHMWFGDLVTMRWWDDLWLNESFATWAGTLAQAEATRWTTAWTTFAQLYKAWAYRQDQLATTHPIAADIPDIEAVEVNFDGITYAKGASVLKQLVAYVGRENFLAGVRKYFAAHAWGNATLADLLAALEETSGRDLAAWSREWLQTAGVNTLRPEYSVGPDGSFTEFAVLQEAPETHPVLRSHRIAIGLYFITAMGLARGQRFEVDVAGERTELPELVGQARPDLVLVNDDDLSYAKIRLDDHSLRTLISGGSGGSSPRTGRASIGDFTESLPAALCWSAAWDMCRDGEMAARDYVRLVMSGVSSISDISVVQTLLRQATTAVRRYADPTWHAAGLELMASTLRSLTEAAEPGSDAQLAYLRALAGVAMSEPDLAMLAGLLDGSVALDGLTVDTDLRWALLSRLVSRGMQGKAEIDAELANDPTDAGKRQAATCRAAIPTAEAKRDAWDEMTAGQLTIAEFRAVLGGFVDLDRRELIEPYREEFFATVGRIWRDWSSAMAQDFANGAYMACPVTAETVELTDSYIVTENPPTGLRRLLTEGRDDTVRLLRGQARDRQAAQTK